MAVAIPRRGRLLVCGRPMSAPLRNVGTTAERMVDHFVEHVYPCAALPPNIPRRDITTVTGHCVEAAIGLLDGDAIAGEIPHLARACAGWARQGIPLDTILHAVHAGFRLMLDQLGSPATPSSGAGEPGEIGDFGAGVALILDLLDTVTAATTTAYLEEMRWLATEQPVRRIPLTAALLNSHATAVAAGYLVAALHIPSGGREADTWADSFGSGRRRVHRLHTELAVRTAGQDLSMLSTAGGTILLPAHTWTLESLEELLVAVSTATATPLTAVTAAADRPVIAEAADDTHRLLDAIIAMAYPPGAYRLGDMAREFQLTRPGDARERLAAMLDPLSDHPELMSLLHVYLRRGGHRRATALEIGIHGNTVDQRLKRISALTGIDPTLAEGAFRLHSALIARGYSLPDT